MANINEVNRELLELSSIYPDNLHRALISKTRQQCVVFCSVMPLRYLGRAFNGIMKMAPFTFVYILASGLLASTAIADRFTKLDRNNDGRLSREEVPQAFRKFKFDLADRNKDGFLDAREMERVARKLSEKKSATTDNKPANPVSPKAGQIEVIQDIAYQKVSEGANDLNRLDLYLPKGRQDFAVLLWIHGGGLHSGDKSKIVNVAKRFVAEGFGVASVNYRLYPEAGYPTQIEDVASAFAWVHRNIARHGGNPQNIFVAGGSAGGYLTALLALNEKFIKKHGLPSRTIRGAIPISGLMDVNRVGTARRKGVWGDNPSMHHASSPLHHARKDAPPILLLYAEHDTRDRRQQNQAMFQALKNAGHPAVDIHELKERTHNSIRPNLTGQDDPGARHILEFIRRHTTNRTPGPKADQKRPPEHSSANWSPTERVAAVSNLPNVSKYQKHPSNRFLIDLDEMISGFPYKGRRAKRPHTGGHVYFKATSRGHSPNEPKTYPAIYAVADGFISRIDYSFKQRPTPDRTTGRMTSNTRYGIDLAFAMRHGGVITIHYSIEPMTNPGDPNFYRPFINVKPGQRVRKGDIIARMYIPRGATEENTHIHFNLIDSRTRDFMAPTIFDGEIVKEFHARCGKRGIDVEGTIPACMGFRLDASENPFGTGEMNAL